VQEQLESPAQTRGSRGLIRSVRLAALVVLALALPVAQGVAKPAARGTAARASVTTATRALKHRGYAAAHVTCSRQRARSVCRWHATRKRAKCVGALTLTPRKGHAPKVAIKRPRCTAAHTKSPVSAAAKASAAKPGATQTAALGSHPRFGFNTYTTARTIAEQREVGATTSRLFADWSVVEPSPGQWNWQQSDQAYAAMLAGGLRPLIVAFTAPCWARPSTDCSNPFFTGPPDPAYDQDWITYVRALAARYPAAIGIEVWNEPNLDQSFLPHANPVRFTQLLAEAYTGIKAVDPTMPVISGGLLLAPPVTGPITGGEGDTQFLSAMYAAGASKSMDGLAVHIYPSDYVNGTPARWDPAAMQQWLDALKPVRAAAGATSQPLWITEMGISTATEGGWPAAATTAAQATDLVAMIHIAQATPNVPVVIIHTLEDQTVGYDDPDNAINGGWGMFSAEGATKPAACAVSRELHGSLVC
jgi:hypothetical protein